MLKVFYRILENPTAYEIVQKLLGGDRVFKALRGAVALEISDITYENVLEVGCGTGLTKDCFHGSYTGVDINPEYIKVAGSRGEGTFLVADATSLPFAAGTYDLVFTAGVLHHLNEKGRTMMLGEMRRVCKSRGHILIADGLVPSSRMNLIGYALAKLDRGRHKMRIGEFQDMIRTAYPAPFSVSVKQYCTFPTEFAVSVIGKD
jgi:ubiquinone/menaquinone biosynthesis C-methylase UbiE